MSLLGLQRRGQITSKIVSCLTYKEAHISENQRGLFVPQDYLPLNSETDWIMTVRYGLIVMRQYYKH